MKIFLISLLFISLLYSQTETKMLRLPALFSDNMVLQQKTNASLWGYAKPGAQVTVTGSWGASVRTKAGKDGSWKAAIKTPSAGGAFILSVTAGTDIITYKNVLIGEVWLCSGQSNMEMPLEGWPPNDTIHGGAEELPKANNDNIRLFSVEHKTSPEIQKDFNGTWSVCTTERVRTFSAVAYFFAKKLVKELNVPVGLIQSTWSGTPAEAWTSAEALSFLPEFSNIKEKLSGCRDEHKKLNEWLNGFRTINLDVNANADVWRDIDLEDRELSKPDYDDSRWLTAVMPETWENSGFANFDGVVWYRKKIELPESWINKDLVLHLGPIDDMDATYVNGEKVGGYERTGFWFEQRDYTIPAKVVSKKELTIAVRVIDYYLGGGMYAKPENFRIQLKGTEEYLSLAGSWNYRTVAEYRDSRLYVFGGDVFNERPKVSIELSPLAPTMIYNAMIAPLAPFNLRGAIWYQGESNTLNPELYSRLFPVMINNWRNDWNDKFSFYFTQIAPFYYSTGTNSQYLRESQFRSLAVSKSGLAVTMDIGNAGNIHPGQKREVGERLALWALAKDYKKKIVFSGPLYKSAKPVRNRMEIKFDHAAGLNIKEQGGKSNFQIAGADKIFYNAEVKVEKEMLMVSSPKVTDPKAVRYCWDDVSAGTLFNGAGLPASSFRTDDWK